MDTSAKDALSLASWMPGRAAACAREAAEPTRVFADIEIFDDPDAARPVYAEIEADALATPYQSCDFVTAWFRTIGRAHAIEPLIFAARNDCGLVTAILPFALSRRGGFRIAEFAGGKHANFHMGVFPRPLLVEREAVADLLQRIGRLARLDTLLLTNQPGGWQGEANPLAALAAQESPSRGHVTKLDGRFDDWLAAHYSKDARKKLRKKARRLAEIGPVSTVVARDGPTARRVLAAFFAHKSAPTKVTALVNDFAAPEAERLLDIVATERLADGRQVLELQGLLCGERVVAVFGGLARGERFCGMITSHDADPEIARCSPGEMLILNVIRNVTERGFRIFDLGVGEASYKDACCEIEEPLSDLAIGFTAKGRLLAAAFLLHRRAKRWIKRTPWAWRLANGLLRGAR